jgi:phage portal protein BeeE
MRPLLAVEQEMLAHRREYFRHGARRDGLLTRPLDAPDWSDDTRQRFSDSWAAAHSGTEGSGTTPILEESMGWIRTGDSSVDQEFVSGLESITRAVAVGLGYPVTNMETSPRNSVQARRQFVADCLVPLTARFDSAVNAVLLDQVYPGQANGGERIFARTMWEDQLSGDWDMITESLVRATGGPVLTPAEARRMLDLPATPEMHKLREPVGLPLLGPAVQEPDE